MRIEKTYIVNLEERIDRLVPLIDKLKSINFPYWVFKAEKNKDGKLGLLHTMKKLLSEALLEGHKIILVLEDDIKFLTDDMLCVQLYMEQLPEKWDCLYLGINLFEDNVKLFSSNLIKIKSGYSSHAIVYHRRGMMKILQAILDNETLPYDELLVKYVQPLGNCYCTFPMVFSQHSGYSDIENKEVNYEKYLDNRFKEKTAHL